MRENGELEWLLAHHLTPRGQSLDQKSELTLRCLKSENPKRKMKTQENSEDAPRQNPNNAPLGKIWTIVGGFSLESTPRLQAERHMLERLDMRRSF